MVSNSLMRALTPSNIDPERDREDLAAFLRDMLRMSLDPSNHRETNALARCLILPWLRRVCSQNGASASVMALEAVLSRLEECVNAVTAEDPPRPAAPPPHRPRPSSGRLFSSVSGLKHRESLARPPLRASPSGRTAAAGMTPGGGGSSGVGGPVQQQEVMSALVIARELLCAVPLVEAQPLLARAAAAVARLLTQPWPVGHLATLTLESIQRELGMQGSSVRGELLRPNEEAAHGVFVVTERGDPTVGRIQLDSWLLPPQETRSTSPPYITIYGRITLDSTPASAGDSVDEPPQGVRLGCPPHARIQSPARTKHDPAP